MKKVSDGAIPTALSEGLKRSPSKGVDECRFHLLSGVERGICKNLVYVGSMCLADIFGEPLPSMFIKLGQMRLVLRIDNMHSVPRKHNDVGNQMSEGSM